MPENPLDECVRMLHPVHDALFSRGRYTFRNSLPLLRDGMTFAAPQNQEFRPLQILMVEDNGGDSDLALALLSRGKISNGFHVMRDGKDAIAFLKETSPDIIFLDLNLPGVSGRDVLDFISHDQRLKSVPVFVMTGSSAHENILKADHLEVQGYVRKPLDADQFLTIVCKTRDFQLQAVTSAPLARREM